jgi:ADP-heptose:LPS heptosyltransferase
MLRVDPTRDAALPAYLEAPRKALDEARARLGRGKLIGLCWTAGDWDRGRSIPLAALLDALPPCRLVSLQRGPAAAESEGAAAARFVNPGDRSLDILETAGLIGAVDLVVTVDSMVAHLAGALGRPTSLLLKHDADWRWLADRTDSPWYPAMRLLRQHRPNDWQAALEELRRTFRSGRRPPREAARPT